MRLGSGHLESRRRSEQVACLFLRKARMNDNKTHRLHFSSSAASLPHHFSTLARMHQALFNFDSNNTRPFVGWLHLFHPRRRELLFSIKSLAHQVLPTLPRNHLCATIQDFSAPACHPIPFVSPFRVILTLGLLTFSTMDSSLRLEPRPRPSR